MTTPKMFGMMCRARIRTGPPPSARLASTNARVRSDSTCPRTMRAMVSHDTAPRPTNSSITRKAPCQRRRVADEMRLLEQFAQRGDEHDDENDRRQRIKHVHNAHQHAVHPPADVTGHGAPQHADDQADAGADDADEQRNLRAEQNAGKNVAPVDVRAEPVLRARRRKWRVGKLVGIVDLGKASRRKFSG